MGNRKRDNTPDIPTSQADALIELVMQMVTMLGSQGNTEVDNQNPGFFMPDSPPQHRPRFNAGDNRYGNHPGDDLPRNHPLDDRDKNNPKYHSQEDRYGNLSTEDLYRNHSEDGHQPPRGLYGGSNMGNILLEAFFQSINYIGGLNSGANSHHRNHPGEPNTKRGHIGGSNTGCNVVEALARMFDSLGNSNLGSHQQSSEPSPVRGNPCQSANMLPLLLQFITTMMDATPRNTHHSPTECNRANTRRATNPSNNMVDHTPLVEAETCDIVSDFIQKVPQMMTSLLHCAHLNYHSPSTNCMTSDVINKICGFGIEAVREGHNAGHLTTSDENLLHILINTMKVMLQLVMSLLHNVPQHCHPSTQCNPLAAFNNILNVGANNGQQEYKQDNQAPSNSTEQKVKAASTPDEPGMGVAQAPKTTDEPKTGVNQEPKTTDEPQMGIKREPKTTDEPKFGVK